MSVLSLAAVEREEGDIGKAANVNNIFAQIAVGFIAAVLLNLVNIGDCLANLNSVGKAVVLLKQLVNIQNVLFIACEYVEQNDLMAFFSECGGNQKSRRN